MPDNDFIEQVRAWLAAQPRGATVRWNHDLARPAEDVHTGWVDVNAPELCETCSLNWLLTIRGPDPDEGPADGYETLEVPHDVAVRGQWDHESHWWVDGTVEVLDHPEPEDLTGGVRTRPAWSTAALNAALTDWAERVAGRGDLVWALDPGIVSPLVEVAMERIDSIKAGTEETYDAGGGVRITSSAMDELLAMGPDDAAQLMARLRDQIGS